MWVHTQTKLSEGTTRVPGLTPMGEFKRIPMTCGPAFTSTGIFNGEHQDFRTEP
jgi:hypothetical protein